MSWRQIGARPSATTMLSLLRSQTMMIYIAHITQHAYPDKIMVGRAETRWISLLLVSSSSHTDNASCSQPVCRKIINYNNVSVIIVCSVLSLPCDKIWYATRSCLIPCLFDAKKWAWHTNIYQCNKNMWYKHGTGIIWGMRPANERRRYNVTSSLIGCTHTHNDPWWCSENLWIQCCMVDCCSFLTIVLNLL